MLCPILKQIENNCRLHQESGNMADVHDLSSFVILIIFCNLGEVN